MQVKIRRNDLFMEGTCLLCGEAFPPDIIIATAYRDDGKKSYGDVCPRCIHDGEIAARAAVQEQIQSLRDKAERLLTAAADLEEATRTAIELPTWETWRSAHLQIFLRRIGLHDDARITAFRHEVAGWGEAALHDYLAQEIDPATQADTFHQALYAIAWHEREKRLAILSPEL